MTIVYVTWGISAAVIIAAAAWIGMISSRKSVLGILIDSRGRFSLSQFQIVLWTIVVLSLLAGVFTARLLSWVENPLNITIPNELLIMMGISLGSSTMAGAIKASKDMKSVQIKNADNPKFSQVFMVEEGSGPETVDVSRFQNFWLTLIVVVAYVSAAITFIGTKSGVAGLNALPGFDGTLLTLMGISHAGYLAGKLPDKK